MVRGQLQVGLSQVYRMFLDICRQKTINYTKYLDEMRDIVVSILKSRIGLNPRGRR